MYYGNEMNKNINELVGKRFGTLVVLEYAYRRKGKAYLKCLCDCGRISYKRTDVVTKSKYCPHRRFIDLTGQEYNMFTVIEPLDLTSDRRMNWLCECECGNKHIVSSYNLRKGRVKSCGCASNELRSISEKIPNNGSYLNKMYFRYKYDATVRNNREFELTKEQFFSIIQQDCHYCGKVSNPFNANSNNINGIDRLDSSGGYIVENCVPCCSQCNISKNTMGYDQFINWIEKVYKHMNNKKNPVAVPALWQLQ